jgi:hypothetical protein
MEDRTELERRHSKDPKANPGNHSDDPEPHHTLNTPVNDDGDPEPEQDRDEDDEG